MQLDEINKIIIGGEGQRVEFKKSFAEENEAIRSLCAFANTDGGTVLFGVNPKGEISGLSLGSNTLENFANKLRIETNPALSPLVEQHKSNMLVVVSVTVEKAQPGQLFYAFNTPFIRIGKTNQVMTADEQRGKLLSGLIDTEKENNRPAFEVIAESVARIESSFQPSWKIKQVNGDYVSVIEWRFRGPRFNMPWQKTTGYAIDRTNISRVFNLSEKPIEDDRVALNELAIELRFFWHNHWNHELHKWPISRREYSNKILWDVGREILPPLIWEMP